MNTMRIALENSSITTRSFGVISLPASIRLWLLILDLMCGQTATVMSRIVHTAGAQFKPLVTLIIDLGAIWFWMTSSWCLNFLPVQPFSSPRLHLTMPISLWGSLGTNSGPRLGKSRHHLLKDPSFFHLRKGLHSHSTAQEGLFDT